MKKHFAPRICLACGEQYQPTNGSQKYCPSCKSETERRRAREFYVANSEKIKERSQLRYQTHREEILEQERQKHLVNPQVKNNANKLWRLKNPKLVQEENQRSYLSHSKKIKEQTKIWQMTHPKERRMSNTKSKAKHRTLGFIPLNQPFVGSQGHHVDHDHILYIPVDLHKSVSHNVWTGRNMEKINAMAAQWFVGAQI